ncbi:MAG TPA: cupin domain-containing protein [Thermomicrobiales bacterium]|nr:cupin domain-containing protein [Thermomicrobiales bacterium]
MTDGTQAMATYVGPGEGEALWFFGLLVLVKASGDQTGGQFCMTEQLGRLGVATPLHRQLVDDETFHVLEGELRFYLGEGEPIAAPAGATAYIPAGMPHAFEVASETARWLNLTTPNHEAFFRAAGDPARERTLPPAAPPDMERVMSAAARFGVEILGPPPGNGAETHG